MRCLAVLSSSFVPLEQRDLCVIGCSTKRTCARYMEDITSVVGRIFTN